MPNQSRVSAPGDKTVRKGQSPESAQDQLDPRALARPDLSVAQIEIMQSLSNQLLADRGAEVYPNSSNSNVGVLETVEKKGRSA